MKQKSINDIERFISENDLTHRLYTNRAERNENYCVRLTRIGYDVLSTHFRLTLFPNKEAFNKIHFVKYYHWDDALPVLKRDLLFSLDFAKNAFDITARDYPKYNDFILFNSAINEIKELNPPVRIKITQKGKDEYRISINANFNAMDSISIYKRYSHLNVHVANDVSILIDNACRILENLTNKD